MSNQVTLTLRPPPNVEHVDGYPGIPPGPNRPHASVKGSIELRTGPAGVKAKWVRIALNKIETLPGGGQISSFSDFVGPSPITLWQANPDTEYGLLGSQDFTFTIRIPESTPPSINLASDLSGIRYELVASVCTKGKKLFLRRRKSNIVSTTTGIIIDKHELHSTWPVYNQPEARHLTQDGVTLNVERTTTCYGPGDSISVVATVKSESLNTIILRGFEIVLKETSIFRSGPYTNSGKKAAPQVRVLSISEAKFPVNVTLYGGNQHSTELSCEISASQTTTTLNTARHIDVTYVICVKALMGTGTTVIMDLPVVVSNWQKNVSKEALRRIGTVPSLSLTSPAHPMHQSLPISGRFSGEYHNKQPSHSTLYSHGSSTPGVDEFGVPGTSWGNSNSPLSTNSGAPSPSNIRQPSALSYANGTSSSTRQRGGSNSQINRLTIVNDVEGEVDKATSSRGGGGGSSSAMGGSSKGGTAPSKWMTADDEKRMLYESAKDAVEKVQGPVRVGGSPPPSQSNRGISPPPPSTTPPAQQMSSSPGAKPWLSAEAEKLRLYERAQAAANRTQGLKHSSSITSTGRSDSMRSSNARVPTTSSYSPAVAGGSSSSGMAGGSSSSSAPVHSPKPKKTYPTAEQEKAAMRRYDEAQQAVTRTQHGSPSASSATISPAPSSPIPVPYDSLYPSPVTKVAAPAPTAADELPTFNHAVNGSSGGSALSEKERLKKAYEAQDAQAAAAVIRDRQQLPSGGGGGSTIPPNYSPPLFNDSKAGLFKPQQQQQYAPRLGEKELLRRKLEAQDKAAEAAFAAVAHSANASPVSSSTSPPSSATSPQRTMTMGSRKTSNSSLRQQVSPLASPPPSGSRILTAVEEKAMMAARYAAEDNQSRKSAPRPVQTPSRKNTGSPSSQYSSRMNGSMGLPSNGIPSPTSPPPLKPKPPKEYIVETQEEDARVSKVVLGGGSVSLDHRKH